MLIDEIVQNTIEKINSKKNALQKWEKFKFQKVQQAYIEMLNKAKTNINLLDINKVTEILVQYIQMLPKFFDFCKDNEKKK